VGELSLPEVFATSLPARHSFNFKLLSNLFSLLSMHCRRKIGATRFTRGCYSARSTMVQQPSSIAVLARRVCIVYILNRPDRCGAIVHSPYTVRKCKRLRALE
jgi:hypothetical protein